MRNLVESNWKPLEERLGSARCAGFMFMGRANGINQYKHGISRQYLFLDDEGRAYEAPGRNEFREIPVEEAICRIAGEDLDPFMGDGEGGVRTPVPPQKAQRLGAIEG